MKILFFARKYLTDLTRKDIIKIIAHGSNLNLRGVCLESVNLSKLDLSRANLSGADFKGADLTGVIGYNP